MAALSRRLPVREPLDFAFAANGRFGEAALQRCLTR